MIMAELGTYLDVTEEDVIRKIKPLKEEHSYFEGFFLCNHLLLFEFMVRYMRKDENDVRSFTRYINRFN